MNRVYNQAAVGLCLSAVEGAMYSSMEYLMAGLPIVSTPSLGGRDVYFDPDYCLIVEPEPAAIRRAVERLRDRAIPREEIRGGRSRRFARSAWNSWHSCRRFYGARAAALLRSEHGRSPARRA